MSEVRNALTKALADGLYLRLDTSNDPLLANLNLGQFDLLEVGKIEGGALVSDTLEIAAHSAAIANPATDGKIALKNFIAFSGLTDFTSAASGSFQLFSWNETVDLSGQAVIIPQGFWYTPTFLFNTLQACGSASLINDGSIWKESSLIVGAHTAFAIGSFTSTIEYMVNHAGVGNPPSAIYGYNSAPAINAGTGTLTIQEMIGYTTNLPSTLKVFFGVRSLENGAICNVYSHYQANSGNAMGLILQGGSIINLEIGLDLIDLNTGLTCITLRSNDIDAYMDHAGNIRIHSDNRGLYLGAALDVLFQYTGLVAYLDTGIITPSDFVVDCGPEKTILLQEPVWDDLRVPLTQGKIGALNPPSFAKFMDNGAGSVGVYASSFAYQAVFGNEEQMWFPAQLSHQYKQGTDIKVHIHWSPAVTGGANQFVKWGLELTWININGTFSNTTIIYSDASSAATATTSGDTTLIAKKHYLTKISLIVGSGKEVSSMLECRIFRNSSHGDDTLVQDAFGLEVDFHYQIDTMGSRQELIK